MLDQVRILGGTTIPSNLRWIAPGTAAIALILSTPAVLMPVARGTSPIIQPPGRDYYGEPQIALIKVLQKEECPALSVTHDML